MAKVRRSNLSLEPSRNTHTYCRRPENEFEFENKPRKKRKTKNETHETRGVEHEQ